jgi:serine/threonine protein kinase
MKQGIECTKDAIDAALREDGRFELLKLLGKGSFGCVCQARCLESQEIVAIKLLPRSEVRPGLGFPWADSCRQEQIYLLLLRGTTPAALAQLQLLWAGCAGEQVCGD